MQSLVLLIGLTVTGCSFLSAAGGDFTPPRCERSGPIADGVVAALALGGCIALAATDDGRAVIPRSVLCVPLGAIALTTAIAGIYGASKYGGCVDRRRAGAL